MTNFYFTFGCGHDGFPGYVTVTAPDADTARDAMFEKYGAKWCRQCFCLEDIHEMDRVLRDTLVWQEAS